MKHGAELIDARARHASAPESFDLPSDRRIQAVGPGSMVKIGVTFPPTGEGPAGERFWVEVIERTGDRFIGRVDNDLTATNEHGLRFNDEVAFFTSHILDTDTFDYLASVEYVDADEDEPSELVVGIVGRYTRVWLQVGDQQMGTVFGPGHRELDRIIDVLSEARQHLTTDSRS